MDAAATQRSLCLKPPGDAAGTLTGGCLSASWKETQKYTSLTKAGLTGHHFGAEHATHKSYKSQACIQKEKSTGNSIRKHSPQQQLFIKM